jgi:hypothetical protein
MKPPLDQSPLIGASGAAPGWAPRGRLAPLASCEDLVNSPARGAVAETATEAVPVEDGIPLDDRLQVEDRCPGISLSPRVSCPRSECGYNLITGWKCGWKNACGKLDNNERRSNPPPPKSFVLFLLRCLYLQRNSMLNADRSVRARICSHVVRSRHNLLFSAKN